MCNALKHPSSSSVKRKYLLNRGQDEKFYFILFSDKPIPMSLSLSGMVAVPYFPGYIYGGLSAKNLTEVAKT